MTSSVFREPRQTASVPPDSSEPSILGTASIATHVLIPIGEWSASRRFVQKGLRGLPSRLVLLVFASASLFAAPARAGEPDKENTEPPQLQTPEILPGTEQILDDEFLPDEGWDEILGYRFLENDRPDAAAHLYTDPTRHFFLYVPSEGGVAYVLEKKGRHVSILDRDQLQWDEQSRPLPPTADTEEFTTFVDADGHVQFDHAEKDYLLEPLPAVV
ncbi:MAG: hypothetical protein KC729_18755, partial [Candidatus Eisenbacteria bacterium]|nr:hypothetical protein [Candidatus Eisenbacteria bacterium]